MTDMRRGAIRIGVSGWRYPPWRGAFYPVGLRQRDELAYAAERMPTIEINGSFYSLQHPASYAQWYRATPPGFVFAAKGGRYITHMLRLKGIESALANFFASGLFELKEKLGPLLWQFPPNLQFNPQRFEEFLTMLPRDTGQARRLARRHDARLKGRATVDIDVERPLRHAVEIRNETFIDPVFVDMLRRHRVALVIADTGGLWPQPQDVTADFLYLRLHGATELYKSRYSEQMLAQWAARIAAWAGGGALASDDLIGAPSRPVAARDVYCYFDNTDKLHAPDNALRLAQMLGVEWRPAELIGAGGRVIERRGRARDRAAPAAPLRAA
jgi:uncharacterized protein YecE (DUF72 family)